MAFGGINAGSVFVTVGAKLDRTGFDLFDRERLKAQREAAKDIRATLGGKFEDRQIRQYTEALDKVRSKTKQRDAFKAHLGADYDNRAFNAYYRDLEKSSRATDDHVRATGRLRTAFGSVYGRGGAMLGAIGATYGLGRAITSVVGSTIDFDRSMRNVNSIAQLPEKSLQALNKQVLDLAGKTAQAPKTLADGLYDLVSSGFDAGQSMKILSSSAKAATAGLTDTATSTHAVASVLNAYHLSADDAAQVSDTLFQTVNRGVINFQELSNSIGDVLPFAAALHVDLGQIGAATSTMTKEGINSFETMTRLKNLLEVFIKPNKDLAAAIEQTGFSSGEALVKQKGFQGALEAVIGTTDRSKESVAALFPNIRALGGALALTGNNAKTAHGDLKAFADVGGATDKALSQQAKSISYQWNKVKAQFTAVGIELGTKLAPAAISGLKHLSKFVDEAERGTGEGGRFVDKLKEIGHWVSDAGGKVKDAAGWLNEHRTVLKAVVAMWVAWKVAMLAASAAAKGSAILGAFGRGSALKGPEAVVARGAGASAIGINPYVAAGVLATAGTYAAVKATNPKNSYGVPTSQSTAQGFASKFLTSFTPTAPLAILFGADTVGQSKLRKFGDEIKSLQGQLDSLSPKRLRDLADSARDYADRFPKYAKGLQNFAQDASTTAADLDRKYKDQWGQTLNAVERDTKSHFDFMRRTTKASMGDIRKAVADNTAIIKLRLGKDTDDGRQALATNFRQAAKAVKQSMHDGTVSTADGTAEIRRLLTRALMALGLNRTQATAKLGHGTLQDTSARTPGQGLAPTRAKGGYVKRAVGGWIGRRGMVSDDVVPIGDGAMAAFGEYLATGPGNRSAVINRHQAPVADMALAVGGYPTLDQGADLPTIEQAMQPLGGLDALFSRIRRPHYLATGGRVKRFAYGGVTAGLASLISRLDRMGFHHGSTTGGGHAPTGYHPRGEAVDYGSAANNLSRLWSVVFPMRGRFAELFGPKGLFHWGSAFSNPALQSQHMDHIHMALTGGAGALGALAKKISSPRVRGSGAVAAIADIGLQRVTGAANSVIDRVASSMGGASLSASYEGSRGQYGKAQLRRLWTQAGGNPSMANLMAAIALAESGGDPSVVNSIGATGLWQIHPGGAKYKDPLTNARTAVAKLHTQGLGAWEAYTNGSYRQFLARGGRFASGGRVAGWLAPWLTGGRSKHRAKRGYDVYGLAKGVRLPSGSALLHDTRGKPIDIVPKDETLGPVGNKALAEIGMWQARAAVDTPNDLSDDVDWATRLVQFWQNVYDDYIAFPVRAGRARITDAATNLGSARSALEALKQTATATTDISPDAQAQIDQANAAATRALGDVAAYRNVVTAFGSPGDIGMGGYVNAFQAGSGLTPITGQGPAARTIAPNVIFQSYVPPSPQEALRLANYTVGGMALQPSVSSSMTDLGI
jgi:TP901 family phage tail tape measure protein